MKKRRPNEVRELDAKVLQLQRYLLNFYNKKIKKLAATQGIPVEFFIQKYQEEIEIQIRVFVEDIYMTRIKNLEKKILKQQRSKSAGLLEMFASVLDLLNIKKAVKKTSDKFFAAVGRLITRANTADLDLDEGKLIPKKPFDALAAMNRVAISAGYGTYNMATESKLEEAGIDNVSLEYVTAQDELVCEICEPFDGQTFGVDDTEIPDLPQHENCRCYLEEVIGAGETIEGGALDFQ